MSQLFTKPYSNAAVALAPRVRRPAPVRVSDLQMAEVRVALRQRTERLEKLRDALPEGHPDRPLIVRSLALCGEAVEAFNPNHLTWEVVA